MNIFDIISIQSDLLYIEKTEHLLVRLKSFLRDRKAKLLLISKIDKVSMKNLAEGTKIFQLQLGNVVIAPRSVCS